MAAETNTDRIRKLEQAVAKHDERLANLLRDGDKIGEACITNARLVQEADKRLTLLERDVGRLEKRLDDLLTRRWELWKLVLAAFLGGLLTVAAGFVGRALDRLIGPASVPAAAATGRQRP